MSTARERGEKPGGRSPGMMSRGLAIALIVAALVAGGLIGYVARGGPDQPDELKVTTPLPVVTVTVTK
ncbi:MAG: hypothetical protein ACO3PB_08925 [Miltoncostaeaceae bacterium]